MMDRRLLALLGLLTLVLLAGCSYDTTIAVLPEVDRVDASDDGHRLEVTVDPDLGNVDEVVSEVEVSGYALDGERVCSATYGDVAHRKTRTLECETFPSLLVADTPDRGKNVEPADESPLSGRPPYTIVPMAALYQGRGNGSHHFGLAAWVDDPSPEFDVTDGRAVPTAEGLQTMQCRQWRHRQDGRDFSTLADAPWRGWELRDGGTDRYYRIAVTNYSSHLRRGGTDRLEGVPGDDTYAESELPPRLRMDVRVPDHRRASPRAADFNAVVDGLSSARVNASENVTAAMRGIRGRYVAEEAVQVYCDPSPPQQSGHRREYVETFATYEGDTYRVHVETGETLEGNAFRNVTAP